MKESLYGAPLPLQVDDAALMHAPLQTHRWELQSNGEEITGLENFVMLDDWDTDEKEGWAWGLQWSDSSGVFPTHYREFNDEWEATDGTGRLLNWTRRRPGSRLRREGLVTLPHLMKVAHHRYAKFS